MKLNELSRTTFKLTIEPSKEIINLYKYFEKLLTNCKTEPEFIVKHRKLIKFLFSCREVENYILVQEDIGLYDNEQNEFKTVIELLQKNHILLEPKKQFGELITRKDGKQYNFIYSYTKEYILAYQGICIDFNITNHGEENSIGFSFIVRLMENGKDLKVVDLYPNNYIGRGISIAIILHAKDKFKKRIISSSNKSIQNLYCEFNTKEAIEKVWKKMEELGIVGYNKKYDFYYTN